MPLEKPPILPSDLTVPEWPDVPAIAISREQYARIGQRPGVPPRTFRVRSFNRLGYLYSVDKLRLRPRLQTEFGDAELPAFAREQGITAPAVSGLEFHQNPFIDNPEAQYCDPASLDLLDSRSFYNFTRDVIALVRQVHEGNEQRALLTWKAGRRTSASMVQHWAKVSAVFVKTALHDQPVDN